MNNQGQLVDLPAALLQLTTLAFLAVAAWAALVALLASWQPTKRLARTLTPRFIRAVIFTTASGTLAIGPAHAGSDLNGLPFPDRGATAEPTGGTSRLRGTVSASGRHVVQAGESLWTIADRALPPEATAAQVAGSSAAWYRTNQSTIGPDPDLIFPGQQLTAPDGEGAQ